MGSFSIWHWLIVLVVVLILFGGRGKVSQLMGDVGKGLKSFRKSLKDDEPFEEPQAGREAPKALNQEATRVAEAAREPDRAAKP